MTRESLPTGSLRRFMAYGLGRSRAASQAQVNLSEARALRRLQQDPMWTSDAPLFESAPSPVRRTSRPAVLAVAAAAIVLVIVAGVVVRDVGGRWSPGA